MQRAVHGTSILVIALLLCAAPQMLIAQSSRKPSPLNGYDFIGGYVGGNLTVASVDPNLIPLANGLSQLSSPSGTGFEFSLSFGRLMPDLFVSTSTTAEFRLLYTRLIGTASGDGLAWGQRENGEWGDVRLTQSTTVATTIAGGQMRFSFDTRPMAQMTPTVMVGATFGHVTNVEYETTYTPANALRNSQDGVPVGMRIPDRRWFYSSLHLGGGGRISLGDPATSPAIVPEVELIIPLTSLARYGTWLPFGLRAGIGLRWPL